MVKKLATALALLATMAAGCSPAAVPLPTAAPVTVVVTVVLTPTPIPATATPAPAIATAAPVTETAAPATAAPTAVPATATTAPATVTVRPTAAVTAGPTPTACPMGASPLFGSAWTARRLQTVLGCPLAADHILTTSFQSFEHGFLFWRSDTRHVYAVYADGTWGEFPDTWKDGDPEYSCPDAKTPSTTPPTPRRGFGKVWCTVRPVRDRLGAATHDEIGYDRDFQDFPNGYIFLIPERGSAPVMLVKSTGQWEELK